jgi:mono/diheme cytochrome c family protein
MLRYFFASLALIVLAVLALAGFQGTKTAKTPLQIFPDMKVQPRYDAQHESDFFADGRAARAIAPGTVPQGYTQPGRYSSNNANNANNARHLTGPGGFANTLDYADTGKIGEVWGDGIPLELTPALLERGRERFTINCAICHGATGMGNGIVSQYGLNGVANFQDSRLRTMPDGQIFETITHGKGNMGAYGSNVTLEDRWAIIAYLRAVQRSQNAKLDDVPADHREDLDKP